MEPLQPEPIGPVPASERITVIDCLRGAALFGIITANMRAYNAPLGAYEDATRLWTWMPDLVWQAVIDCLVSGKFITIFAALFGVGFAIQMDRATARGEGIAFYQRRLQILLAFGLVHAFVFWWGDILISYALCGFYLLFFRHSRQRSILVWAHALYWFIVVLYAGFYVSTFFHTMTIEPEPNLREVIDIYARGTVRQIFVQRAKDWLQVNSFIFFLTRIVGIFLFGLWIWRQGYLAQPDLHLAWWKRAQRYGLTLGLLGSLVIAVLTWIYNPHPMTADATHGVDHRRAVTRDGGAEPRLRRHRRAAVAGAEVAATSAAVLLRRPHGFDELPDADGDRHHAFLQLWLRPLRALRTAGRFLHRPGHLRPAGAAQPMVAEHAPLRAYGVVVAPAHIWSDVDFFSSLILVSALSRTSVLKLSAASVSFGSISSAFSA